MANCRMAGEAMYPSGIVFVSGLTAAAMIGGYVGTKIAPSAPKPICLNLADLTAATDNLADRMEALGRHSQDGHPRPVHEDRKTRGPNDASPTKAPRQLQIALVP